MNCCNSSILQTIHIHVHVRIFIFLKLNMLQYQSFINSVNSQRMTKNNKSLKKNLCVLM